jgi:hypothetical protein
MPVEFRTGQAANMRKGTCEQGAGPLDLMLPIRITMLPQHRKTNYNSEQIPPADILN